jgi:hypothetical protein
MSEHRNEAGADPRPVPYDLIFGSADFDEGRFELIAEQARAHRAVTAPALVLLPAAGELLRGLLPEESRGAEHRDLVAQVSALLFHAFRFWLHGRCVCALDEATARSLLTRTEPVGEWPLRTPAPAGYVQLPRHLVWSRVAEDAAAEPVDGFFWSAPTADEGARGQRLDLLLALGVRRDRPGLSVVDASLEDSERLVHWADVDARPGGTDFENVLPGGELQGYHSLTTQAEVLKLASRCFWYLDTAGAAGENVTATDPADVATTAPSDKSATAPDAADG